MNESVLKGSTDREIVDNQVIVSSWVLKRSLKTHQWQKRWAVLRKSQLSYYKSSNEHKPNQVISKANLLAYLTVPDKQKYRFAIYTGKRLFHFEVETSELFTKWSEALDTVINDSDDSDDDNDGPDISHLTLEADNEYLVEEGELQKLRKRYNQWKTVYVVLTNRNFYVCKNKAGKPKKVISVKGLLDVVEVDEKRGRSWCLMLISPPKRVYIAAKSEQEMTKWLSAMKAVIIQSKADGR